MVFYSSFAFYVFPLHQFIILYFLDTDGSLIKRNNIKSIMSKNVETQNVEREKYRKKNSRRKNCRKHHSVLLSHVKMLHLVFSSSYTERSGL